MAAPIPDPPPVTTAFGVFDALTARAARLVATYSRQDEFAADRGAAEVCGSAACRSALGRLEALSGAVVATVGAAVDKRAKLSWWESRPLFGWRVLVPRTKEQSGGLVQRLRSHGAVPEEVPTISVEPPRNPQQMDRAIRGLVEGRY